MTTPAIAITFFAAILGSLVNVFLFQMKSRFGFSSSVSYEDAFMMLVALMILRHQLRVVFIDSSISTNIKAPFLKAALWILFPLGLIGTSLLISFAYKMTVGSIIACIYAVLFIIFWLVVLRGITGTKNDDDLRERRNNAIFGLAVDIGLIIWWYEWIKAVMVDPTVSIAGDQLVFAFVIVILMVAEICLIFRSPIKERWKSLLNNDAETPQGLTRRG